MTQLSTLTDLLDRLDEEEIRYTLSSLREGAVLVSAAPVDEERWEIEFSVDGEVEVEIFKSNGDLYGAQAIEDLFDQAD